MNELGHNAAVMTYDFTLFFSLFTVSINQMCSKKATIALCRHSR
jgi:hypothetical protein